MAEIHDGLAGRGKMLLRNLAMPPAFLHHQPRFIPQNPSCRAGLRFSPDLLRSFP